MKFTAFAAATLAGCAAAYPHMAEEGTLEARQDPHPYILNNNNPNAVRSPCPGTNTLANHGFINRNGICITKQQYQQGFLDAFNMAFSVTDPGTTNAINLCTSITGRTCTCFNLDMLAVPHAIEHDGSMSRRDKKYPANQNADNQRFNQTIWDRSLSLYGSNPLPGIRIANTVRLGRNAQAQRVDLPGWYKDGSGGEGAEHAFILSSMNDPAVGINLATPGANPAARMDWINYWMVNMRLPTALGWVRPTQVITGPQVSSLAQAVLAAPTFPPPYGRNPYQKSTPPPIAGAPNKRDIAPEDEWSDEPAVPLRHRDVPTSILSVASAIAIAQATPAPAQPNAFSQVLAPEEWDNLRNANAAHQADFTHKFDQAIASIQAGDAPPKA